MSQLDLSGCRKRKRGERVFKFKVFGERGYPAEFNGSFQENVRALLEFGHVESCGGPMASWSFQLEVRRHPLMHLFLFVVEEPIELSFDLRCNHCHYIGIDLAKLYEELGLLFIPYRVTRGEGHSLHGVFHPNGFGHLLCINGSESGSDLPGHQIMDFWDRLCSGLGARKVSLKDVAKKRGMDLRLLHTVAYGKPWFGHWDYVFGRGSYGVSLQTYQSAVKAIQSTPLSLIISHQLGYGTNCQNEVQIILPRYQILSSHSLITLGDLFHFMLKLKFRIPKESSATDTHYPRIMSDASCRWSPKRVETAIHVVVEALKRAEFQWVSRQQVRDIARAYVGDTGLLDFVLKSLGNHMVGKYFVRRCLNPVTKVLEYCLEDASRAFPKQEASSFSLVEAKPKPRNKVSWGQLMRDIFYMYKNILISDHQNVATSNNGVFANIHLASRVILDSKYLVKEYRGNLETYDEANKWKIHCAVVLANDNNAEKLGQEEKSTPYHCIVLRSNAMFDELRCEVEKTFRGMYFGLRDFAAESVRDYANPISGSDLVFKTVRPGSKIVFECNKQEGTNGGLMVIDCLCGAKDDDGERLVTCDICQVWQHTRCVQIPENDEVPSIFICSSCEQDIMRFRSLS
ncbi:phd finger protein male sterility 1 [Phtheirospermum japonicum]|uniref:Phd finger protein male sterility 1 n=1 Tax=Phtheirospermum japonicum TaxID=374723 RepID=A0A830BM23_9LAMI|nr:phd finger protein male sterility 1 [Phtheirospermum japonicum]